VLHPSVNTLDMTREVRNTTTSPWSYKSSPCEVEPERLPYFGEHSSGRNARRKTGCISGRHTPLPCSNYSLSREQLAAGLKTQGLIRYKYPPKNCACVCVHGCVCMCVCVCAVCVGLCAIAFTRIYVYRYAVCRCAHMYKSLEKWEYMCVWCVVRRRSVSKGRGRKLLFLRVLNLLS